MALKPGEAYCIKCKTGKPVKNKEFARYKNNMPVERGNCTSCGTRVTRMLTKVEALQYEVLEGKSD